MGYLDLDGDLIPMPFRRDERITGYPVSDPPSFEAFRESWTTWSWSPDLDLPGIDWKTP